MRQHHGFPISILLFVSVSLGAVQVSLAGATVSLDPPSLTFAYAKGGNAPPSQTFKFSSVNPSEGVDFYISRSQNCDWLALSAMAGTTPAEITATVNTGLLATGSFFCYLTITAVGTAGPLALEATLSVFDHPPITASPASLAFKAPGQNQQPLLQGLFLFAGAPVDFFITPTTASGGTWLTANFSGTAPTTVTVSANPAGLPPGVYKGAIKILSPSAKPASQSVPVTLTVPNPNAAPPVAAGPEAFTFSSARGSRQPQTRHLTIAGPAKYESRADVAWLNVTPATGTVKTDAPGVLSITADPWGREPGTYTGSVTVSRPDGSTLQTVLATMTISASAQSLALSQTGLSFRTCAGGTAPPQTVSVSNGGSGTLPWSLASTTLSGGTWLNASPTGGSAAGSPSSVTVQVSAAGLTPGDYYGQLRIDAPGADNSPQFVGVVLTVPTSGNVSASVDPVGLIFAATPGDPNPAAQTVTVANRGASPLRFESSAFFGADPPWFTVLPSAGYIDVGQKAQIALQPKLNGLLQGVMYQGELNLGFSDRSAQKIRMRLSTLPMFGRCACTDLIPMVTCLGGESPLTVGRPFAMGVKVLDNCGATPQGDGAIELQFSNGDPSVPLMPLGGGEWEATFTPKSTAPGDFEIRVQGVMGSVQTLPNALSVSAAQGSKQPFVLPHGVSSAASYSAYAPIAPGSLINIYGDNFADRTQPYIGLPFPMEIAGTEVLLAGQALPLLFVSDTRIIAQVPYQVAVNTTQQMVVKRGTLQSVPEAFAVAPAQPAIFTVNQQGSGQGVVTVGNSAVLADAAHPVTAGDLIVIYCSGLGTVSPAVATGVPAPSQPLSRTTAAPSVTIDGTPAEVLFSGLTPGFAGLYQINAIVPAGVTPGNEVPVLLNIAGQTGPAVTIAVRR